MQNGGWVGTSYNPGMTISVAERERNLNEALIAMVNGPEQHYDTYFIDPKNFPQVLPTTWPELIRRGWLEDRNLNIEAYRFTDNGFIQALNVSGRSKDREFQESLGRLCSVMKAAVQGRRDIGIVVFHDLVTQARVSEIFASNAINCDLIGHIFEKIGATWDGEQAVKVPIDFGLPRA